MKSVQKHQLLLLIFCLSILISCIKINDENSVMDNNLYFSIELLVNDIKQNMQVKPPAKISKIVNVNGESEKIIHHNLDDIEDVFDFIVDNDINKPAFTGIYDKEIETVLINNNKIFIETYRLKKGFNATVKLFRLYYLNSDKATQNLKGITIIRSERNKLYNSRHILDIRLQDLYLTSVNIKSEQDILFFKKGEFLVNLEVEEPLHERIKSGI